MMNNLFLSTVKRMFGSHSRTSASDICFTPQTEGEKLLAPAFGKIQRVCTFIPGSRFCIDVEEGRMVVAVEWTPRANESKHLEKHRFVIDATGGSEVEKKDMLPEKQMVSKDSPAGNRATTSGKPVRREEAPESPSKTTGLVRRVADYLTSRYYFRFNVLTEQTEYAERTIFAEQPEKATDPHTYIYQKVDKRALNTLSLDALEAGVECWDREASWQTSLWEMDIVALCHAGCHRVVRRQSCAAIGHATERPDGQRASDQ